ncbi:hypothetical protein J6590_053653 [Homalodisca vitripennis]|nr:hypothetical protein J6590_053653 [Homalodisca vitripennis]
MTELGSSGKARKVSYEVKKGFTTENAKEPSGQFPDSESSSSRKLPQSGSLLWLIDAGNRDVLEGGNYNIPEFSKAWKDLSSLMPRGSDTGAEILIYIYIKTQNVFKSLLTFEIPKPALRVRELSGLGDPKFLELQQDSGYNMPETIIYTKDPRGPVIN